MMSADLLILGGGLAGAAASAFCWFALRPRRLRCGATEAETQESMTGDELVVAPHGVATRSVTIKSPPEDGWPWLVRIRSRRARFYAYDRIGFQRGILAGPG